MTHPDQMVVIKLEPINAFTANIYLFKVNNRKTRKRCEICSKLTIKTTERRHLFLVFSQLTFTYSKSAIETPETGVKYVQS